MPIKRGAAPPFDLRQGRYGLDHTAAAEGPAMACPTCQKDPDTKYRPFCSKRCADIDLGKWFDGTYTVAGDEAVASSDDEGPKPH